MSLRATLWVFDEAPTSKHSELLVLLCLADHANDDGTGCWPSVRTLARRSRSSERTVQYTLRSLEEKGLIRKGKQSLTAGHRADRRPTVYDIILPRGADSAPRTPDGVQNRAVRGAELRGYGVQRIAPEPSLNLSLNRGVETCRTHILPTPCRGCAADRLVVEENA
jgi:hypothetical protein